MVTMSYKVMFFSGTLKKSWLVFVSFSAVRMANTPYNTEKALQIILETDSDSELSDLSGSEDEE